MMALKFKHPTKAEIPVELQFLCLERDGAWCPDVDGAVDRAKLAEFRGNNIALANELKDLRQRFEGIDPDEVRKPAGEKRKLEEAQQLKAGEVEKVVETRVKSARADLEKQLSGVTLERDSLNARLTSIQIDQAVMAKTPVADMIIPTA